MTWAQLLTSFEMGIHDAASPAEILLILRSPQMTEAKAHIGNAKPEHQVKLDEIMVLADQRLAELQDEAPEEATAELMGTTG